MHMIVECTHAAPVRPTRDRLLLKTRYENVFLYESANFSQASLNFPQDRRNSQCLGIATYAIATLSVLDKNSISKDVINDIIVRGDEYYLNCRQQFKDS